MTVVQAIVLAIVEGLTEFLPVSSTGHLVIAQSLMGIESTPFVKAFTVMIQLGAILSVVVLYWRRFFDFRVAPEMDSPEVPAWKRTVSRFRFYIALLIGLLPAVGLGVLFGDWVDHALGSVWIIAVNLLIGGVVMLFIDKWLHKGSHGREITYKNAFIVGLFQTIAMFMPGMSRSMSTIVGGMVAGMDRKRAAEFSFFLAVPTMLGATCYEVLKFWKSGELSVLSDHMGLLVVGNVISFIVALAAVRFFITFVQKHTFASFGWYRIAVAGVILAMLGLGMDLAVF